MKNLLINRQRRRALRFIKDTVSSNNQLSDIRCTVDTNNGNLYVLIGNQLRVVSVDGEDDISTLTITKKQDAKIVALEYCLSTQELYCAYETGDIARIDVTIESHFEYEIMATFSDGLQCMKLSPDHEIITVITGAGAVVSMLTDFQIVSEVDLQQSGFGEKQFVTVGWGKKDTQFHGSAGKTAAKAKSEPIVANLSDDGLPRITWREDGTLFAVTFLHAETKIRQFKIFNRAGTLQYTSEPLGGLEECLAWKPSGNLIAAPRTSLNKYSIVLFEKNGLQHEEFSLPFDAAQVKVKDLLWSPNSDVLAIVCQRLESKSLLLQLWSENNYHWYLKQTIVFSIDNPLIYATWNTAGTYSEKELILLTLKEIIFSCLNWCVNHSRGKTVDDKTVVAVIDNDRTLLTAFGVGIVPPPMAHQYLLNQEPINFILFAPHVEGTQSWINSNVFCTVSCNNNLTFFRQTVKSSTLEYEALRTCAIEYDLSDEKSLYSMHHFLWFTEDTILCSKSVGNRNLFCVLSIDDINSTENHRLRIQKAYYLDGPIEHIIPSPDADTAYIVADKSVWKYTKAKELESTDVVLKELSCQVEVIKIASKHLIISLSHSNRLFIDGKEVANNITSFYVHSEFFLLTTLQHTLISVLLNEDGLEQLNKHDLSVKPWEHDSNDKSFGSINIRRIERGSFIIVAISNDSKILLQMPRGNVEVIQPRPLSLRIIGTYLKNLDYRAAFDIMRRQRINLNFIYDYDPELFVENAAKFVDDIANPSWLSLFLSELQKESISDTMYADYYRDGSVRSDAIAGTKIDKVCGLLRDIMERRHDADQFIQPIMISLVKNQHRIGLEAALGKLKVKITEDAQISEQDTSSTASDDALRYLLYIVDINVLYDTALGMYDFDLTMFVASKSQKDPKEYVPFLNSLKKLDENYMKYSIDMHLKRYESALEHITKDPSKFDECFNLVRSQNMYTKALELFQSSSMEYKRLAAAYGEFLLADKKYLEAGNMFRKSEDLNKALNAYTLAGNWRDVVALSKSMKLSSTDLHELYTKVVERLKADRRYEDAAEVLRYHLNDAEEAIAVLCNGKYWNHAIRLAHDIQRLDLNETHIQPGVCEHAQHVMSCLSKLQDDFRKYKSRLASVRAEMKQTRPFDEMLDNDDGPASGREVTDLLSDTSSVTGSVFSQRSQMSSASGRSYRSNKNRRKQERKIFSLKEGSTFEDLALIRALRQILDDANRNKEEWNLLVEALMHFKYDEYAKKIQAEMEDLWRLIESGRSEIWDNSAPTSLSKMERMFTAAQLREILTPFLSPELPVTYSPNTEGETDTTLPD